MQKPLSDPGVGVRYTGTYKRIINKDGSFNVVKHGRKWGVKDLFQYLVTMKWGRFLLLVLGSFIVLNLLFACLYVFVGTENIRGANPQLDPWLNAFFFSVQTLTTIGYGHLAPQGLWMNIAVSFQAFVGLLSFALGTGLMYARFSRPSVRMRFSDNLIIAPYKEGKSLMFRFANERSNVLMDATIKVMLTLTEHVGDKRKRNFYRLDLETDNITFFPLSWTVVHPINEDSPLYNMKMSELKSQEAEILISFKAFDDAYSETVYARYSYTYKEIKEGYLFEPAFNIDKSGITTLDLNKVNWTKKV